MDTEIEYDENYAKLNHTIIPLSDAEFSELSILVYDKFGIHLTDKKKALISGRLNKVIKRLNLNSFKDYTAALRDDTSGHLVSEFVNRISTNHTFFFREKAHFDFLTSTVLPEIRAKLKADEDKDFRLWCAGCATGEEPYTQAMLLKEFFADDFNQWQLGILATDISADALQKAQEGIYPFERVREVPPVMRQKYFTTAGEDQYKVIDALKKMILYRRLNFMSETFPFKKKFHVIFCRNVMIYFDKPTRETLVEKFYEHTAPGGWLFIGHSESLDRRNCPFKYIRPAVYQKV